MKLRFEIVFELYLLQYFHFFFFLANISWRTLCLINFKNCLRRDKWVKFQARHELLVNLNCTSHESVRKFPNRDLHFFFFFLIMIISFFSSWLPVRFPSFSWIWLLYTVWINRGVIQLCFKLFLPFWLLWEVQVVRSRCSMIPLNKFKQTIGRLVLAVTNANLRSCQNPRGFTQPARNAANHSNLHFIISYLDSNWVEVDANTT